MKASYGDITMKRILLILTMLVIAACTTVSPPLSPAEGAWDFTMDSQMGSVGAKVTMVVTGSTITGGFGLVDGRTWAIENGVVDGSDISFDLNRDGANMTYVMKGQVEGDSIKGKASAMGTTIDWSMTRAMPQ